MPVGCMKHQQPAGPRQPGSGSQRLRDVTGSSTAQERDRRRHPIGMRSPYDDAGAWRRTAGTTIEGVEGVRGARVMQR